MESLNCKVDRQIPASPVTPSLQRPFPVAKTTISSRRKVPTKFILLLTLCAFIALSTAQDVDLGSSLVASGKGFRILGAAAGDVCGVSVSTAGDVNNDGIDDVIVSAYGTDVSGISNVGISYVFFGRDIPGGGSPFSDVQLPNAATPLPSTVGFRIIGAASSGESGYSLSAAGDVNGDGVDDIIIGAIRADPGSKPTAGISYVVFGRDIPTGATPFGDIQLSISMSAGTGFCILGAATGDFSGWSVSAAGDVNNDGIGDVIVGARSADPPSRTDAGIAYVIFGRNASEGATSFSNIQLTTGATALLSNVGFRILGAATNDNCGVSVATAGDINNDGIDDIIIGANGADPPSGSNAGVSYVIFGRNIPGGATAFGDIQLTTGTTALLSYIGFRILGAATSDNCGVSVSSAGDVNNDGVDDVIVGAPVASPSPGSTAGIAYVIFGRNIPGGATVFGDIQLTTGTTALSATVGFRILGTAAGDSCGTSVSAAGDVNGDGIDDVIVGATGADPPSSSNAGISYVIYGRNIPGGASSFADIQLTTGVTPLSASVGFRIRGATAGEFSGSSVRAAGDVNNDGMSRLIRCTKCWHNIHYIW